jgi:hypothetical protein
LIALLVLSGLQLIVTLGVGALLWRRLDNAAREIERLRKALHAAETAVAVETRKRVHGSDAVRLAPIEGGVAQDAPRTITELRRRETINPVANTARADATLSPETLRGLALAVAASVPAIGFFIASAAPAIVATGLVIAAAMMLVALRPLWRVAAWASVINAGVWAAVGFALGVATDAPGVFSFALTAAGVSGLAHAHMRRATPGVSMAFVMGAAALALGAQIGLISAAGAAFGAILVCAAIVGAMSLRLESVHLCAFGAALVGLFALSGQHDAAIWFTPVTSWLGAVFLAITAIRVPELGARGLALAGTGALASIGGVAALHASGHGLADPTAAAAVFALVALALAGIIVWSARHEQRGVPALGLTLWVLACSAFFALSCGIWIALPAPVAAPAFAALALALVALDWRAPHAVWRMLAWMAGALAAIMAVGAVSMLLSEARHWAPWALIALGVALPAVLAGGAAYVAERKPALATAGAFESFAIIAGVASANLTLRAVAANGAVILAPIGFAEAGLHIAAWLGAALLLAARADFGARTVRRAAVFTLGVASLVACAITALLWLTPYWAVRDASALIQFAGLGFLAPAILMWAHWAFWRARKDVKRARIALGAASLTTAAFATLLTLQAGHEDWLSIALITLAFALAIGVNFVPGVTAAGSDFHKDFHRQRRRQARTEAR